MPSGARNSRTPFALPVAREGWATQRSATFRPSASVEVACKTLPVASALDSPLRSESAPPARSRSFQIERRSARAPARSARWPDGLPGVSDLRAAVQSPSKPRRVKRIAARFRSRDAVIGSARLTDAGNPVNEMRFPAAREDHGNASSRCRDPRRTRPVIQPAFARGARRANGVRPIRTAASSGALCLRTTVAAND